MLSALWVLSCPTEIQLRIFYGGSFHFWSEFILREFPYFSANIIVPLFCIKLNNSSRNSFLFGSLSISYSCKWQSISWKTISIITVSRMEKVLSLTLQTTTFKVNAVKWPRSLTLALLSNHLGWVPLSFRFTTNVCEKNPAFCRTDRHGPTPAGGQHTAFS